MPKRSNKRRANGVKLRRLQLAIDEKVFEEFAKIAGDRSYVVTFEAMTLYLSRKMSKRGDATHQSNDLALSQ